MRRFLVAAAVVLAAADHAPAQVTPPPPAPFTPPPAAPPQLVVARVVGDKLVWETTQHVPVTQKVKVTVLVDGRPVVQEREVVVAQAVKVERQTLTLAITDPTLGALTRSFEQVTLNLPDGGTTPALESFTKTLNLAAMQGEALVVDEQVASAKSDPSQGLLSARVRVVINRAPFLVTSVCTDFQGPYPSTECQQQRFRVDTGASFTWFSAVPKNKQSALLSLHDSLLEYVGEGGTYEGYRIQEKLMASWGDVGYHLAKADSQPHCVRAYARDSRKEDGYRLNPAAVGLRFSPPPQSPGSGSEGETVELCSNGLRSCQWIKLLPTKKGFWKVAAFPHMFTFACEEPPRKEEGREL